MIESLWLPPPSPGTIPDDEVHVWRASLDLPPQGIEQLQEILSADEREKAQRFRFARDHDRYVAGRGLLRVLLSHYVRQHPASIRFAYNPFGKPLFAGTDQTRPYSFNLSHSHQLALYAIAPGRHVGVDVEFMRPDLADEQIAERFFSPQEVAELRSLPTQQQTAAFFNCWTRKEAYIKARGEGLSIPLDRFRVSLAPGAPAALLTTDDNPVESARWTLQALFPGPDYAAALAIEGRDWRVRCWQLTGEFASELQMHL